MKVNLSHIKHASELSGPTDELDGLGLAHMRVLDPIYRDTKTASRGLDRRLVITTQFEAGLTSLIGVSSTSLI